MDKKYTVTDHNDGKKYDITEHVPEPAFDPNGYPIYLKNTAIPITEAAKLQHQQREKTTDELIAEAKKLFQKPNPIPVKTKKEQELEQRKKEIEKQYRGKIPYNIFEQIEKAFDY
jgi:hypothetical protein